MAASNWPRCFSITLEHEGGYVDHPSDPGGATNLGITIGTLSAWLGRPATKAEVRALTPDAVRPIYRRNYWDKVRGDDLPMGVDLVAYDAGVNSGPARGAKWLQRAVGVSADGVVGPVTLAAVAKMDPRTIINRACDDRLSFLRDLKTWGTFGKGWSRRVEEVRSEALRMAAEAPHEPAPKPETPKPQPAPAPKPAEKVGAKPGIIALVIGGIIAAAAAFFGLR